MMRLACPVCFGELVQTMQVDYCDSCLLSYEWLDLGSGIHNLVPHNLMWDLTNSAYTAEMTRYDKVTDIGPDLYGGYKASKPQLRAKLMRGLLLTHVIKEYINVGPGFGELETACGDLDRTVVDYSKGFLRYVRELSPLITCVRGLAERLPLVTESVGCLVADSVFQSVINRELFLYELARVTAPNALVVLTIAYEWNYPRRPQNGFNIDNPDELDVLKRFLDELGFDIALEWYNLNTEAWAVDKARGDILYIIGRKRTM